MYYLVNCDLERPFAKAAPNSASQTAEHRTDPFLVLSLLLQWLVVVLVWYMQREGRPKHQGLARSVQSHRWVCNEVTQHYYHESSTSDISHFLDRIDPK